MSAFDARVWVFQNQMPENEGLTIEFKDYSWELRKFRATTNMVVCAFLNSEGGSLFFGVDDQGRIVGTKLTQEQYDQYLQHMNNDFHHMFHPTLDISNYAIQRHQVFDREGFAITDSFVIEIKAIKPQSDETYFVKERQNWIPFYRRDGTVQRMLPGQIKQRLRPAQHQQDDPRGDLLYIRVDHHHVEEVAVPWYQTFRIPILLLIIGLVLFIFKTRGFFCSYLCPQPEPSIFWSIPSLFNQAETTMTLLSLSRGVPFLVILVAVVCYYYSRRS